MIHPLEMTTKRTSTCTCNYRNLYRLLNQVGQMLFGNNYEFLFSLLLLFFCDTGPESTSLQASIHCIMHGVENNAFIEVVMVNSHQWGLSLCITLLYQLEFIVLLMFI